MAFNAAGQFGGAAAGIQQVVGAPIEEVQTKEIGFHAIAGEAKVRLLPGAWPADNLPPSGCSLLAIAPTKGLLVAAGPEGIAICSTDSLRQAFSAPSPTGSNYKPFKAQLELPIPQKISHITFTRDDMSLVVVTQDDHGIIAFEAAAFLQNRAQPAFNVPTPNIRFRHFIANPAISKYFAAVTYNGELMVVDMSQKRFMQGPHGPVLLNNCSSVSWSKKGKQLVAGRMDCTMVQMTPEGEVKAEIPRPSDLENVSAISWLENNTFLVVYSSADVSPDLGLPSEHYYFIFRENRTSNFTFRSAPEAALSISSDRLPPKQFITRIISYEPHLDDCLIVLSTSSTDVGLYTRASKPLSNEHANPAAITNEFTLTTMSDDSRRAQVPMTESLQDTTPVGVSLDLSTMEPVVSPIPTEEIPDSGVPLPGLAVLNTEGVLSYWYIVYSDAVKEKKLYRDLAVAHSQQPQPVAATPAKPAQPAQPAFGQSGFSNTGTSPFAQSQVSNAPSFGKPSLPAFGQSAFAANPTKPAAPAFGSPTPIGAPAFGAPSTPGPAFGKPAQLGTPGGAFGQSSPGTGFAGFASTSKASGFSAFASTTSLFGQATETGDSKASPLASAAGRSQGGFGMSSFGTGSVPQVGPSAFGDAAAAAASPFSGVKKPSFATGSPLKQVSSMDGDSQAAQIDVAGSLSAISNLSTKPVNPFGPKPALSTALASTNSPADVGSPMRLSSPKETPVPLATTSKAMYPPAEQAEAEPAPLPPDFTLSLKHTEKPVSDVAQATPLPEEPSPDQKQPVVPEAAPLPPDPTTFSKKQIGQSESSMMGGLALALPDDSTSSKETSAIPEPAPFPPDFATAVKAASPGPESAVPLHAIGPDEDSDADLRSPSQHHAAPELAELTDAASDTSGEEESVGESDAEEQTREQESEVELRHAARQQAEGTPVKSTTTSTAGVFPAPTMPSGRPLGTSPLPSPEQPSTAGFISKAPRDDASLFGKGTPRQSQDTKEVVSHEDDQLVLEPAPEPTPKEDTGPQDIDEHEFVRQKLAAPVEPSPFLDPLVSCQNYGGRIHKLAVQRKIELLYRDVTAMIDTVGINARSMASYLLYQQTEKSRDTDEWLNKLRSEESADLLDELLLLPDVEKLQAGVGVLSKQLNTSQEGQLGNLAKHIQDLLGKDLVRLRGQCIAMRRTIDAHTDLAAVSSAPLSAEQGSIQFDLRKASMELNTKVADLERDLTNLRAKLAEITGGEDYKPSTSAVASTIAIMAGMVQEKTTAVDELEMQMRKLGINITANSFDESVHLNASLKGIADMFLNPRVDSGAPHTRRFGYAGSAAGVLSTVSDEEMLRLKKTAISRKKAMDILRQAVEERDAEVRVML
ncbi:hypothetical protein KEM54_002928 [Ascosphaera aggregata]|nr:hypothetical protein KEM54_002928 [Ascosphaera aggregata]